MDLDALVIEENEQGDFDFRFEVGDGLAICWVLPAGLADRLRLIMVDHAAAHVDEPEVRRDPFVADFGPMTFEGPVGPIRSVTVELKATPPSYMCAVFLEGRAPVELRWPG